ncbi:hypothetical protein VFA_003443 [Vibrio furnissii CIP 102972]|nr:hypothetical protein VFA_003443 [Vibrio furnissii CIP 102972]
MHNLFYLTVFIGLFNFAYFRHARGTVFALFSQSCLQQVYQDKLQCSGRTALNKPTPHNGKD